MPQVTYGVLQVWRELREDSPIHAKLARRLTTIDCGMEEVVEYLEIAHQPPHTIDDEVKDSIEVSNVSQGSQMKTTMPRIVFRRQA